MLAYKQDIKPRGFQNWHTIASKFIVTQYERGCGVGSVGCEGGWLVIFVEVVVTFYITKKQEISWPSAELSGKTLHKICVARKTICVFKVFICQLVWIQVQCTLDCPEMCLYTLIFCECCLQQAWYCRDVELTLRLLMSYIYIYIYIYGAPILDVSRSHTTTQHSR